MRGFFEAGSVLFDRYHLSERLVANEIFCTWAAVDDKLSRPVGIHLIAADHDLSGALVGAAQAAASIDDGRFLRILDAAHGPDLAYVVYEWTPGACTLGELIKVRGAFKPAQAQGLIAEAAEAMAVAHAAGLAHLRLHPGTVLLTRAGQTKILGLCVDAVLHATTAEQPAVADAQGLGRLLYAALTARWPNDGEHGLGAAPYAQGVVCAPRQVRAGVPEGLNAIIDRIFNPEPRAGTPLRSPAEVAAAMQELARSGRRRRPAR